MISALSQPFFAPWYNDSADTFSVFTLPTPSVETGHIQAWPDERSTMTIPYSGVYCSCNVPAETFILIYIFSNAVSKLCFQASIGIQFITEVSAGYPKKIFQLSADTSHSCVK
jgi:hypothetical protein